MTSLRSVPRPTPTDRDSPLPRYDRPREAPPAAPTDAPPTHDLVPFTACQARLAASSLSPGSRDLLLGLLRTGTTRLFPGGGVGIEYGSLLKTAARPEYVARHAAEAAAHLRDRRADLLLVPGMSGYPIGAMYALLAGLPALLLKKAKLGDDGQRPTATYPTGAFVIPSYTGDGDVVMHADPAAVADIVADIVAPQLARQANSPHPTLTLRAAGADDIIDKATMSQAVGESAVAIGDAAIAAAIRHHRLRTADQRPIDWRIDVVAWVTPLIKGYNRPHEILRRRFALDPFAGLNITSVHLDPPAITVAGVDGLLAFASI